MFELLCERVKLPAGSDTMLAENWKDLWSRWEADASAESNVDRLCREIDRDYVFFGQSVRGGGHMFVAEYVERFPTVSSSFWSAAYVLGVMNDLVVLRIVESGLDTSLPILERCSVSPWELFRDAYLVKFLLNTDFSARVRRIQDEVQSRIRQDSNELWSRFQEGEEADPVVDGLCRELDRCLPELGSCVRRCSVVFCFDYQGARRFPEVPDELWEAFSVMQVLASLNLLLLVESGLEAYERFSQYF